MKVTFFATVSSAGRALAADFAELVRGLLGIVPEIVEQPTQARSIRANLKDDLVIFDASVEEGHNYAGMTLHPAMMEHVFLVSRTPLPMNVPTLRQGGAPRYPHAFSNEQILEAIQRELQVAALRMRRPWYRRGFPGMFSLMTRGIELQQARLKAETEVFISYRSRAADAVYALAKGEGRAVFFFEPGSLAWEDELLREQQRWTLISLIDARINAAREVWVYDTPDYLNSWWTRAELAAIAVRVRTQPGAPRLRRYDPQSHQMTDAAVTDFIPLPTEEQAKRYARWHSNADPALMNPAARVVFQTAAELRLLHGFSYLSDHAWSEAFWEDVIVPCTACCAAAGAEEWDFESVLWTTGAGFHRLPPMEIARAVDSGEYVCPSDARYAITRDHSRWLWRGDVTSATAGKAYGSLGPYLIERPVYRVP